MSTVLANLKFTFRMLLRRPISSLVLILTLALGIGVNAAIFSIFSVVLLRPLPYPQPDQLVAIWEAESEGSGNRRIPIADGNIPDIRAQTDVLQGAAAYSGGESLIGLGTQTVRAPVAVVTRDFFPIFRVSPMLGRSFGPDEHGEGTPAVGVISHGFWMSAFGGSPEALGKTVSIYGEETTIVGVMPPGFDFPRDTVLWVDLERELGESRTAHNNLMVGRLADGVTPAQAQTALTVAAGRLASAHPGELGGNFDLAVVSLHDDLVGNADSTLILLFGIVGLVLLIACGNIAGILLSRTVGRFKELAIRQAAGAGTGQLTAQLLIESATIGLLGSVLGLVFAYWSMSVLNAVVPRELLHSGPVTLDARVITFGLILGVITGLLCGLAPIVRVLRADPLGSLHPGMSADLNLRGSSRRRLGGLIVVPQYVFSLVALVVAGLLIKSLFLLLNQDPGYRTSELVTSVITLPVAEPSRYAERPVRASFYRSLAESVSALPGVRSVTYSHTPPLATRQISGILIEEGQPRPGPDDPTIYPYYRVVGAGYFETMGIRVLRGRDFAESDDENAEPVAIVNEALADLMWPGESPIGKRVVAVGLDFRREESARSLTVVGEVASVRQHRLDAKAIEAIYAPWPQHPDRARALTLIAHVEPPAARLTGPIRDQVRSMDPSLPVSPTETFEATVRKSVQASSFRAGLLAAIAVLALLLALLGVFGVMHYSVSQRIREMAIRMALGARRWDLQRMFLGIGLRYVLIGQIIGTIAVLAVAKLVEGFLYNVSGTDLPVLVLVSVCLAIAVLLTCYIPSRRASRVDPIGMLKEE